MKLLFTPTPLQKATAVKPWMNTGMLLAKREINKAIPVKVWGFTLLFLLIINVSFAENDIPQLPDLNALYYTDLPNPTEFNLFANGGWDGGWFVGYTKTWIQKIDVPNQPIPIAKAFIGAKLGRMKVKPSEGKPAWESTAVTGTIYIAVSSTPSWKNAKTYVLTSTDDIPYEGASDVALVGVGESRWFWIEVPLQSITFEGSNYIALWSSTKKLADSAVCPILAAGWDMKDKNQNTWLNAESHGKPPDSITADSKPISYFDPAIGIKLSPANNYRVLVHIKPLLTSVDEAGKLFFTATVTGVNIEKVWVEISTNDRSWQKYNRCLYNPPYVFTLDPQTLPRKKFKLRASALDELGNVGVSNTLDLMNQ